MEYNPPHFKIENEKDCLMIARQISFASIIYYSKGRVEVSHNPVYVDIENRKVFGHFAKGNPICDAIDNNEVLISFQGEHGLIKPDWYEENGQVPTWNYRVVHIRGVITTSSDHQFLRKILELMAEEYKLENINLPENLLNAIVGFELEINEVDGKDKLHQNKDQEMVSRVIHHLEKEGNKNLARIMSEK